MSTRLKYHRGDLKYILYNSVYHSASRKWVPGCGIRLIAKDYTIFTQFKDLTPAQIMDLFKEFKSWPEYESSYFLVSMMDTLKTNELHLLELEKMKLKE